MSKMTENSTRRLLICAVVFLLSLPCTLLALTKSFDNINFKPTTDNSGYFTIYGSRTIAAKNWLMGFYLDYANSPIEFKMSGGRKQDLIKDLMVMDIYGALGITKWWSLGLNVPVVLFDKYTDPLTRDTMYRHSLGDVRLETKFRLLDPEKYKVGISLVPFVTIPTRLGDSYVSNQSFAGGGIFAVDYSPVSFFSVAANIGFLARSRYTDAFGADIGNQMIYGIGLSGKPSKKLAIIIELNGATAAGKKFGGDLESPLELRGGVSVDLPHNLSIKAGAGSGVTGGFGNAKYRIFGGLSYNYGAKSAKAEVTDVTATPETPSVQKQPTETAKNIAAALVFRVQFREGGYVISENNYDALNKIANILNEYPSIQIRIDGYSCSIGSEYRNIILSTLRAIAVENYLVKQGVSPARLTHEAFGSANPVGDNSTKDGRAINRRVEFSIVESP